MIIPINLFKNLKTLVVDFYNLRKDDKYDENFDLLDLQIENFQLNVFKVNLSKIIYMYFYFIL